METNSRSSRGALALAWWFCVAALMACGGGSGDSPAPGASPAPSPGPAPAPAPGPAPAPAAIAQTPAGDLEGLPTFATIGAAGGTLASSDGRLTISVPSGALAADTVIGIEPITTKAPGAFGSDYRLTPEGIPFAQPVTLTFSHSAAQAAAVAADSLRVATRDARGHWRVAGATRDAAQRKTSVTTTHFSDWSYVAGVQLAPAQASVKVRGRVPMSAVVCGDASDPDPANDARVLLECRAASSLVNWAVNGIRGGNDTFGTLNELGLPGANVTLVDYIAPAAAPDQNPVAVSADIDDADAGRTTLVSNIRIVDETVYVGAAFGRVVTRIGDQEQWVEMSANLRFTHNPELSVGGAVWYDGTGTAHVRGKPFGCSSGGGGATVQGANLVLHTEGPLAGTYALAAGALASATLTCGDPPQALVLQLQGGIVAGGSDICPALQTGDDPSHLSGAWFCNVGEGSTGRANWTLRAVE